MFVLPEDSCSRAKLAPYSKEADRWSTPSISRIRRCELVESLHKFHEEPSQIPWFAPEYIRQDITGYTEKVDVYSIGILALELAFGSHPYAGLMPTEMLLLKLQDETGPIGLVTGKRKLSSKLVLFLNECLREEDYCRPVADKLCAMPFLRAKRPPAPLTAYVQSLAAQPPRAGDAAADTAAEDAAAYDDAWVRDVSRRPFPELSISGLRYVRPGEGARQGRGRFRTNVPMDTDHNASADAAEAGAEAAAEAAAEAGAEDVAATKGAEAGADAPEADAPEAAAGAGGAGLQPAPPPRPGGGPAADGSGASGSDPPPCTSVSDASAPALPRAPQGPTAAANTRPSSPQPSGGDDNDAPGGGGDDNDAAGGGGGGGGQGRDSRC